MAEVEYSSRAVEYLDGLDIPEAERIVSELDDVAEFPDHYLRRLSGSPYYRLRVGDRRAIVDWRKDDDVLFVREIGHRRNVYD